MMDSALATSRESAVHAWYEIGAGVVASGGRLVADHLWQSTLFALAILALVRLLPSAPARLRYNLYLFAVVKFFLPSAAVLGLVARLPLVPADWLRGGLLPETLRPWLDFGVVLAAARRTLGLGISLGANGLEHLPPALWWSLATVWGLVSVMLSLLWLSRMAGLKTVVERAREVTSGPVHQALERGRLRLGLRRPVRLVTTDEVVEPGVWGAFWPVVVLPEAMPRHLSSGELESVLLHELLHVRRWDNLAGHLLLVLRGLLWFHPLVWWLDRRLLAEREQACDERVLEVTGSADAYLKGLAKVLRRGLAAHPVGISLASGSDFQQRLRRLRGQERPAPTPFHRAVWLAALVLMVLSSSGAARLGFDDGPTVRLQTARDLARGIAETDELDPQRLPQQAPRPAGAACDDLRRM